MNSLATQNEQIRVEPFLFDVLPAFSGTQIDFMDSKYFDTAAVKYQFGKYKKCCNPYIENEIKGFVQHLVVDCRYTANTIRGYLEEGISTIVRFINKINYSECSITDVPFETLYNQYLEFLSDNHIKIIYNNIHAVRKDMTVKTYPSKSQYIIAFTKLYRYVYDVRYPDTRREYEKDCWDVRNLGVPYSTAASRNRFTVNFNCICQPWLRKLAKEYTYYRIQNRSIAAVIEDLKALRFFSEFLNISDREIQSLGDVDRKLMEEYYAFLSGKGFVATTYNHRISALRTFFIVGSMLGLDGFPEKPLVVYSDYRKVVHKLPKYFSDNELKQINQHISDLPIQIARMLFILENCGMRVSDICTSEISYSGKSCLVKNFNSEYTFTYSMPKVHRNNTIPISTLVAEVIQEAISYSQEHYGSKCKYIFAKSIDQPISVDTFSNQVNRMSLRNNIVRDDGTPLRITGHTFRGTVATQYANCGISMDVIRLMLGQKKLGVLSHYVAIHEDKMIEYLKPITDESNALIQNIGKSQNVITATCDEPALIPPSNGRCAKSVDSGICDHAYACYSCRMFRPTKECLPIYKMHYQEALSNIEIARLHGYDRILDINQNLKDVLEKIIKKVEAV